MSQLPFTPCCEADRVASTAFKQIEQKDPLAADFIWESWAALSRIHEAYWEWGSPHELHMLHRAGVTLGDIKVGIDRWQTTVVHTSDWGFIRAVAWNEALKRTEILAGIEHGAADRQRA